MKAAILTWFPADPAAPCGGVEAVSVNLVKALAEHQDVDVHVLTLDRTCRKPTIEAWHKATIHRLPRTDVAMLLYMAGPGRRTLHDYLLRLKPDVIHAHDTYGLSIRGLPYPRVLTIHGFIHADTRLRGGKFAYLRSLLWRMAEESAWADQHHIISISPYVRQRLRGVATGRIHDIENPIDDGFFDIDRDEQKGVIFCPSLITPRKNTLALVEAFAQLIASGTSASLRLAGSGDAEYQRQVRNLIRGRGIARHVTMLGKISMSQVQKELKEASILAIISLEEGAPMAIAESMAAGVPVVASNRCGMPYMVRNGESGYLVEPDNLTEIATRMRELLENDSLRENMGNVSRKIALGRFHPTIVARKTYHVYRQAIESGRSCNA